MLGRDNEIQETKVDLLPCRIFTSVGLVVSGELVYGTKQKRAVSLRLGDGCTASLQLWVVCVPCSQCRQVG